MGGFQVSRQRRGGDTSGGGGYGYRDYGWGGSGDGIADGGREREYLQECGDDRIYDNKGDHGARVVQPGERGDAIGPARIQRDQRGERG